MTHTNKVITATSQHQSNSEAQLVSPSPIIDLSYRSHLVYSSSPNSITSLLLCYMHTYILCIPIYIIHLSYISRHRPLSHQKQNNPVFAYCPLHQHYITSSPTTSSHPTSPPLPNSIHPLPHQCHESMRTCGPHTPSRST